VGDPATFLVGSSIGMTFGEYLHRVSLGGVIALLIIVPLLPLLMPDLWRLRRPLPPRMPPRKLERPIYAALSLAVLLMMVALFILGDRLPARLLPPTVALIAGSLALLIGYAARFEPTDDVLRDVDWKTLLFLGCIFCLVQAVTKTGLLQAMALKLNASFGAELTLVALTMIAAIGLLSSLLANVPVAAASILMVKGYLVAAEVVPDAALGAHFTQWPAATIPVFVGMMFGATLGGNATLIGASANIVSAGICARRGKPVTFATFMRYGLPITVAQLIASAIYVLVLSRVMR
jgi:Na+/H+ antiporter NhaD/arsenite permease-like protein